MKALFVAAALLLTTAGAHAEDKCLEWDSGPTLAGAVIVRHTDSGYPVPLLVLDKSICISEDDGHKAQAQIWIIQLVERGCFRKWVDMPRVKVVGDLSEEVLHVPNLTSPLLEVMQIKSLSTALPPCDF